MHVFVDTCVLSMLPEPWLWPPLTHCKAITYRVTHFHLGVNIHNYESLQDCLLFNVCGRLYNDFLEIIFRKCLYKKNRLFSFNFERGELLKYSAYGLVSFSRQIKGLVCENITKQMYTITPLKDSLHPLFCNSFKRSFHF